MARRKGGFHRRRGGGFFGLDLKKVAMGAVGGYAAAKLNVPIVKSPIGAGVAGYLVGKKSMALGAAAGSWFAGGMSTNVGNLTNVF